MKTLYLLVTLMMLPFSNTLFSQSTETFETESSNSNSFTDNGVVFNIITHVGGFDIQANYPGTGWNGNSNDNRYIDNSGTGNVTNNASFSIKTTSNLFKVQRFWVFLSNNSLNQTVSGTLTITGKLSGTTVFSQTKTSGFATSLGSTNGHTLIDLTNLNGQNYSNTSIDQLQITLGGAYTYCDLDAFTWVKDSSSILATNEAITSYETLNIYPNPAEEYFFINSERKMNISIVSETGQMIKIIEINKGENRVDISKLPKGIYFIRTESETRKIIKN